MSDARPPGWYWDPAGSPGLRWWSGTEWGPLAAAPQAVAPPIPATQPYGGSDHRAFPVQRWDQWSAPAGGPYAQPGPYGWPGPAPGWPEQPGAGARLVALVVGGLFLIVVTALVVSLLLAGGGRTGTGSAVRTWSTPGPPVLAPPGPARSDLPPGRPTTTTTFDGLNEYYKPAFEVDPLPPAGYEGYHDVMEAAGIGPMTTPVFTIRGFRLGGGFQQSGTGAYFYLVPDGQQVDESGEPTASCTNGCASGGWAARSPVPPGRYRLKVVTGTGIGWKFDLDEFLTPELRTEVSRNPDGSSRIEARGTGNQRTPVFRLQGAAGAATVQVRGNQQNDATTVVYLVPKGQPLAPAHHRSSQAASTARIAMKDVPAGEYYLVVRSSSIWQVTLSGEPR